MPATESAIQSHGTPRTYTLRGGRAVEVRNGCVVDTETRLTLCGSDKAAEYLLARANLTQSEKIFLLVWGKDAFGSAGATPMSRNEIARMKS